MLIEEFNALDDGEARAALLACVAIDEWAERLVAARPYGSPTALVDDARALAAAWSPQQIEAALADHPRIGERPRGEGASSAHSRREQAGVDAGDAELARRLAEGNARYEERFGRIYLVRAKGRSGAELLALLEQRLANDPATELEVTREQLAEIALLRLADLVGTDAGAIA